MQACKNGSQLTLFDPIGGVLADDERGRIEYMRGFVAPSTAQSWFTQLRDDVEWRTDRRIMYDREVDVPRLLAHYRLDPAPPFTPPTLVEAAAHVAARLGVPFNSVGLNLYRGRGDGHTVTLATSMSLTAADTVHGDAFVAFPPSAVALHLDPPQGSPRNTWQAAVTGVTRHGDNIRVRLAGGPGEASADVTPAAAAALRLEPGQRVWAAVKATETRAYPAG